MIQNSNANFLTTIKTDTQGSPKNIINLINSTKMINPKTQFENTKLIVNANNLMNSEMLSLNESHENSN